ncbi:hypothetical protein VB779_14510 [Haloarculaceae archaeon H-GB11]|nr:hypothetical protein [Haloarculaceae archaeon H-GB11]
MSEFFTPDVPVFVGASVAVLCWFVAALLWVTAPSSTVLGGLTLAFVGLGGRFSLSGCSSAASSGSVTRSPGGPASGHGTDARSVAARTSSRSPYIQY